MTIALVVLVAVPLIGFATTAGAATPTYPVMNTSEYPPDGVYFRTRPDWAAVDRTTGYGVFAREQVRLRCSSSGTNVPRRDGGVNTVWYYADNVSRPSVGGRSNTGWINAHFVDDGTGPNQVADGVTPCDGTPAAGGGSPVQGGNVGPIQGGDAGPIQGGGLPPGTGYGSLYSKEFRKATDDLIFRTTLSNFVTLRNSAVRNPRFDWETDDCSAPFPEPQKSSPLGYDFHGACWRHDFGYHNYKLQGRFTEDTRHLIDDNFRTDMNSVCNRFTGWSAWRGVQCRRVAADYYFWVRSCGANPAPYCPDKAKEMIRKYT